MALPPAEELSRWTVKHVTDWLTQSSLTAFRGDFLQQGIDGNKLMRLKDEIDKKFRHIPAKKRNALKDHLNKIECSRPAPTWISGRPNVAPRTQDPATRPQASPPGEEDSDDGWGDDEFDDTDYLEPESKLPSKEVKKRSDVQDSGSDSDGDSYIEPVPDPLSHCVDEQPPPRPPRAKPPERSPQVNPSSAGSKPSPGRVRLPPQPVQPVQNTTPPEDVYEIMNDAKPEDNCEGGYYVHPDIPESTQIGIALSLYKKEVAQPRKVPSDVDPVLPPRPEKKLQSPNRQSSLASKDELNAYEWYHGKISRDHAQKIFHREQKDGMFLIRKSERDPTQPYTLVIWHSDRIWNIPIRKLDSSMYAAGKYKEGETKFDSLVSLVEHFKTVSLNLKSAADHVEGTNRLTIAAPKR